MSRKWRRSAKYFKKFFILKSHRNAYASFFFFKLSLFAFSILSIHLSKKKEEEEKKESIRSKERDAISRNNSKGRFLWFMKKKRVPGMRDPATPDKSRPLYDPNNQDPSIRVGAPTRFLRTPPRRRRSTYQSVVDSSPGSKEILSPVITYRELASPHTVRILPPTPEYFYNILPGIISGQDRGRHVELYVSRLK